MRGYRSKVVAATKREITVAIDGERIEVTAWPRWAWEPAERRETMSGQQRVYAGRLSGLGARSYLQLVKFFRENSERFLRVFTRIELNSDVDAGPATRPVRRSRSYAGVRRVGLVHDVRCRGPTVAA